MIRDLIAATGLTRLAVRDLLVSKTKRPLSVRTVDKWLQFDSAPDWAVKILERVKK